MAKKKTSSSKKKNNSKKMSASKTKKKSTVSSATKTSAVKKQNDKTTVSKKSSVKPKSTKTSNVVKGKNTKNVKTSKKSKKETPKTFKEKVDLFINDLKKKINKTSKNITTKIKKRNKKIKLKINKYKKERKEKLAIARERRFKNRIKRKEENSKRKEEILNKIKSLKDVDDKSLKEIEDKKIKKIDKKASKEERKEVEQEKTQQLTIDLIEEEMKGAKKERKRLSNTTKLIILGVVFVSVLAIVLLLFLNKKPNEQTLYKINLKEYTDLYNSESLEYIFITEKNCTYCDLLDPYIKRLQADYDIEFNTLDITNLNEKELEYLKSTNTIFEEDFKAPILISIKNGETISSIKGYKEYSVLKKFIDNSVNPSDNNSFVKININKYLSLMKETEKTIIYVGRPNSSGCDAYVKVLEEVSNEKNFTVYYLNTDTLDTEDEWDALEASNEIFKDTWFVPVTLIIKDGKLVNYKMESMDKDSLMYFLDKNGV